MSKSLCAVFVGAVFLTGMLYGCNKTPQADSSNPSASAIAAPDVPAAPAAPAPAPASDVKAAGPGTTPSASAGADVSVQGTEARAGDVSVKLPD